MYPKVVTLTLVAFFTATRYKFFFFSYNTVVINHRTSLADDKISIGQNTFFFFFLMQGFNSLVQLWNLKCNSL